MKTLAAATGIAIVFVYVIGSGLWVNTGDNWYRSLNPPPWQPPDFIFGIIWPYNFIVLAIAAVTIAQRASTSASLIYLGFFALSVICALTWAFQFYRPHNLQAASIALTLTAADARHQFAHRANLRRNCAIRNPQPLKLQAARHNLQQEL